MLAFLIVFGVVSIVGMVVLALCVKSAPEGYQSSEGFRYGRAPSDLVAGTNEGTGLSDARLTRNKTAAITNFADVSRSERVLTRAP